MPTGKRKQRNPDQRAAIARLKAAHLTAFEKLPAYLSWPCSPSAGAWPAIRRVTASRYRRQAMKPARRGCTTDGLHGQDRPSLMQGARCDVNRRGHEVRKPYSVRRECLDHILVLGEGQLRHVLREYADYFNTARPHQGIGQAIPDRRRSAPHCYPTAPIVSTPVLGGLHHAYRRAA
jgi:hypothetical protein